MSSAKFKGRGELKVGKHITRGANQSERGKQEYPTMQSWALIHMKITNLTKLHTKIKFYCTYSFHGHFNPIHLHDCLPDGLGSIGIPLLGDELPHGLLQLLEKDPVSR